jgi:hypothetical protein
LESLQIMGHVLMFIGKYDFLERQAKILKNLWDFLDIYIHIFTFSKPSRSFLSIATIIRNISFQKFDGRQSVTFFERQSSKTELHERIIIFNSRHQESEIYSIIQYWNKMFIALKWFFDTNEINFFLLVYRFLNLELL